MFDSVLDSVLRKSFAGFFVKSQFLGVFNRSHLYKESHVFGWHCSPLGIANLQQSVESRQSDGDNAGAAAPQWNHFPTESLELRLI
jgi:hypothetical protein